MRDYLLANCRLFFTAHSFRAFATLFKSAAIGQGLLLISAPILTRLYTPEDFGTYGVFTSIVGSLGVIASLRIDQAIVLARNETHSLALARLASNLSLVCGSLTLVGTLIVALLFPKVLAEMNPWVWALSCGLGVTSMGIESTLKSLAIYGKRFSLVANVAVLRSALLVAGQIAGYSLQAVGLCIFNVLATFICIIPMRHSLLRATTNPRHDGANSGGYEWKALIREFKDFPLYNAPDAILTAVSMSAPTVILSITASSEYAGHFFIAMTMLQRPLGAISTSLQSVFYQYISEQFLEAPNKIAKSILSLTLILASIVCIPFLLTTFFGELLFTTILGAEWLEAGRLAPWIMIYVSVLFAKLPARVAAQTLRLQKQSLIYQVILFVSRTGAMLAGCWLWSPWGGVVLFCCVSAACELLFIFAVIEYATRAYTNHIVSYKELR